MVSNRVAVGLLGSVERCFELGGRDVTEVAVQPGVVVPVHPSQGGQFDVFDYIALCREHYDKVGIGSAYIDGLMR